ncbi:MAG: group II intron maturase-specific domain-containing protein, partial [Pseudomonadota bacterium]|nr:group II intron maturase-specific domain-containing protein [Pseudomonadota bacterium]
ADDFIITGISQELLEDKVKPLVEAFMAERGLTLSKEKTLVTHVSDGFDFLGQNLRSYNGKLLIKPSRKNLRNVLGKLKQIVAGNKTVTAGNLIMMLNPVLQGWANYHRHVVAKETFNYVDYRVWKMLWKWCRRRHQNRHKRWVKDKYFKSAGNRNWVFSGVNGKGNTARLVYTMDTAIKRHIKIKAEANPYLPEFEEYFEQRLERVWKESFKGRDKLLTLWLRQRKRCVMCNNLITKETGWNIHHVIERVKGGSDKLSNLVLLHPNCHRQHHCQ